MYDSGFGFNLPGPCRKVLTFLELLFFALGIVCSVVNFITTGAILFFIGMVLLFTAAFLRRRSPKGCEELARWRAFRRFLLRFSEMKRQEIPSLVIWEEYLPYAITLTLLPLRCPKSYAAVANCLSQFRGGKLPLRAQLVSPPFALGGGRGGGFDSLLDNVQRSMRAAASRVSSGSGGGGSFSGGSGFSRRGMGANILG
ncbi:MAG: hypothetical protein AB1796_14470 [Bacillota bacterium]